MNEIQIFNSNIFGRVRTIVIDGEIHFVGKDVAEALGYVNASKAVITHVDEEDKQKLMLSADSQNGNVVTETTVINESGLYSLVLSSKLPQAKEFKKWITSDVIPSIRKTGSYSVVESKLIGNKEDSVRASIAWVDGVANIMKLNDSSKLLLLQQCGEQLGLPTPAYTKSKDTLHSATELLKKNNVGISIFAFNKLAIANSYLEVKSRMSSHGKIKHFNSLTEKGLLYGENQVSPQNPKETQPLYYDSKFMELCKKLGIQ